MKSLLNFFMFLLHFCLVVYANVPAQSQCHEDDLSALLQIKKKSLPDSSWNSSTACCSWVGVSCSTDGHVIGLDISGKFIASQIDNSSSLFDLQHLQSLNMSYKCYGGNQSQIPSAFGKLTNLRYLNLSGSCYSGQVPIEIAHLTKLAILDLSDYNYVYDPLTQKNLYNPNLSTIVQSLTELTELYLDGVTMSALDTHWCQSISSSLPRLQVLSLSSCNLSGPIDPSLAKLQSLSVIRLDDNNKLPVPVPGVFANLSNLTSLSLRSCMMRGIFPIDIFQVPTLQTIDLSDNPQLHGSLPEFSRDGSLHSLVLKGTNFSGLLPESIGNLRMLSLIDLTGCSFTGPIPNSIQNLTKLVHLHMSSNKFSGGIPSSIFSPPLLEELLLSHNQFSGQLHEFSNVSSYLATIDLSFNDLEGVVPASIYSFRGLEALDLSSNNFSGFPFNGPQQLSNLSTIDLSYNSLLGFYNGTTSSYSSFPQIINLIVASNKLRAFPNFFRNHTSLYRLDLSANQIQGMIPNWIWGLSLSYLNLSCNSFVTLEPPVPKSSTVSELDLHSNHLQGQIPVVLLYGRGPTYRDYSQNNFNSSLPTEIPWTKFLSLSSNNLHGAIPVSICNNGRFEHLDMSNNSLSGNIPGCLLAMSGLRTLSLGNNNLSGAISNSFGESCGLQVFDLGRNQMEGQFPKSLANCTELQLLNLGNNHMIDTFPCFLKKISTVRVLALRSNKLYGGIGCSKTNGSWPNLQIIDLSQNSFSGEILGSSFTTWDAMMSNADDSLSEAGVLEFLDDPSPYSTLHPHNYADKFDYYAAIRVIGKGLEMDLVKITTVFTLIDFSSNKFNGSIPKDFGELKSLYALNLSSNAFTGEIPSSLGNLRKLESLDLSLNKLRGQIPSDFTKLTFLSFLNLSNNQLVGMIPTSTQFSTFPKSSFLGNKGLWGPPLTKDRIEGASPPTPNRSLANSGHHEINWDLIIVEIGFAFGFGVAVCSLVICKRWSKWYYRTMYKMVVKIFPQVEERIGNHRRHVHINQRWRN